MTTYYTVAEGEAREYDPDHTPPRDSYGTDWIIVPASDEADALEQARLYDARCHPAQTEMELYAALYRAEPPLLAAGDIARLAGVTPNAVRQWVKRYPEFRALARPTSAGLIWSAADVLDWLRRTGRAE